MPLSELDLFRAIFRDASVGMAIVSKSGHVHLSNATFQRLLSAADDERRPFISFITEDDRDYVRSRIGRVLEGREPSAALDARVEHGDGRLWCRINLARMPVATNAEHVLLVLVEDIGRQKENEERLIRSKQEADTARAASESAAQSKSDFLANVSHEIRTPIHTILGMTELLTDTRLDPEQQEYAGQIGFSADVLLTLVNDILDYSKIEAGKLSLESIEFDLYKVAEEAVDLVSLEAHKKGLEVILFIENDVPQYLNGDPVRLRQIVVNLFNNAVKFTAKGEIVVSIMRIMETDTHVRLHFFVKDTGIGIPADRVTNLFQSFTQVDSSTTRKFGGTGLGLSISKSLVGMMGGEIGVESKEGVGSTFWFTLDYAKSLGGKTTEWERPEELAGSRALVVDDNESARIVLSRYLSGWGCEVDHAESGPAALERLRSTNGTRPYDLCFVDLLMPRMDGWQLGSEINADKTINATKLFLLSPAGKSGDEAKMKLLGWFDGYLTKPVMKRALYELTRRAQRAELDLPVAEEVEPAAPGARAAAASTHGGASAPRITAKVLVAEDHEVNRGLFRTILEGLGCEVHLAENGKVALAAASAAAGAPFDIIFMDVQMPELNGYDASSRIRELGITTPIVAVTASAIKGEEERCRAAGMSDFLTKPFKKRDLLPVLERWIGPGRADGAPPAAPAPSSGTGGPGASRADAVGLAQRFAALDAAIFDYRDAVATFMGKSDVVERMLAAYLAKVETQLPKIREALAGGRAEAARAEAHSIKGSGWNLRARRIGDAAAKVEAAASEGDVAGAGEALGELEAAFEELRTAVAVAP